MTAISLLNKSEKEQIHRYTMELLSTVGIQVGKPEIR